MPACVFFFLEDNHTENLAQCASSSWTLPTHPSHLVVLAPLAPNLSTTPPLRHCRVRNRQLNALPLPRTLWASTDSTSNSRLPVCRQPRGQHEGAA